MNENKDKNEGDADHIERVRRRAFAIWMDEGQVHGRDHEHWHQAEREIAAETSAHAPPAAAEPREKSQAAAEPREKSQAAAEPREAPQAAGGSKTTGMAPPSPKSATTSSSKTTENPLRTGP
jgi:hypothetical protein